MSDNLHNAIITHARRHGGWQTIGWRDGFRAACRENAAWQSEIDGDGFDELFGDFILRPDAWRIVKEGPDTPDMDWERDVLVLEFLEVEIAHPMPLTKRRDYIDLWMRLDGSDHFHLRVYRAERYMPITCWLDFDTVGYEMGL